MKFGFTLAESDQHTYSMLEQIGLLAGQPGFS